jgi:hypothetical protein
MIAVRPRSCARRKMRTTTATSPTPICCPCAPADLLASVKPQVPELPHEKRARFETEYGCSAYDAGVLASEKELATWYEAAVAADAERAGQKDRQLGHQRPARRAQRPLPDACRVPGEARGAQQLVATIEAGKISNNQAKEVFRRDVRAPANHNYRLYHDPVGRSLDDHPERPRPDVPGRQLDRRVGTRPGAIGDPLPGRGARVGPTFAARLRRGRWRCSRTMQLEARRVRGSVAQLHAAPGGRRPAATSTRRLVRHRAQLETAQYIADRPARDPRRCSPRNGF